MAKKKAARPAKKSQPSRRNKTEPSKLAVQKRQDHTDSITVRPEPLNIQHRENIEFSIILNDITAYTIESFDLTPDEGAPVTVKIPKWLFYAPTSETSADAVDLYSITTAKVYSTDESFLGIASGKLTITIRPTNSIEGEPSSITYEYKNVNFIPG